MLKQKTKPKKLFKYPKYLSINNFIIKQFKDHASSCLTKTNTISPLDLIFLPKIYIRKDIYPKIPCKLDEPKHRKWNGFRQMIPYPSIHPFPIRRGERRMRRWWKSWNNNQRSTTALEPKHIFDLEFWIFPNKMHKNHKWKIRQRKYYPSNLHQLTILYMLSHVLHVLPFYVFVCKVKEEPSNHTPTASVLTLISNEIASYNFVDMSINNP